MGPKSLKTTITPPLFCKDLSLPQKNLKLDRQHKVSAIISFLTELGGQELSQ